MRITFASIAAATVFWAAAPSAAQTPWVSQPSAAPTPWTSQTPPAIPAQTPPTPPVAAPPAQPGQTVPPKGMIPVEPRRGRGFGSHSTQAFQVILLVAEMQGTTGTDGLPKSALRALDDLKDFLPFKGYRALDMAWIRTTGSAETRLTGPTGQAYYARLNAQLGENGTRGEKIFVSSFELRDDVEGEKPTALTPKPGAESATGAYSLSRRLAGSRIISTSFGMEVGETVVVGTSKITGGDKALVVLLTAVPPAISRQ